ncbi:MAG TPA: ATP synthase F0 subunit A [Clostridiales bacterium]|nr:ATP synthase F0 subunit A [Clostridiales bacterium]
MEENTKEVNIGAKVVNKYTETSSHQGETEHKGEVVYQFNIGDQKIQFVKPEHSTPGFFNDTANILGKNMEVNIFGNNIQITETIFNTWIIIAVFAVFAIFVRLKATKFKQIPSGFQGIIEIIVDTFENFTKSIMGEKNKKFAGFYMSLFIFILAGNWVGMFALRNPTADIATTFALSFITIIMMHGFAIYAKGIKEYLEDYLKPSPIMLPINMIEKIIPGISLAFRLFGNILSGVIILSLCYSFVLWIINAVILWPLGWLFGIVFGGLQAIILIPLHMFLDIFVGALQAFIFVMLSMTFVAREMSMEHEEEHEHKHA